jgi:hypothetical protein
MKVTLYILLGIIFTLLIILIIGLLLPNKRTLTKQTIYDASIEKVYSVVTNNHNWKYRTSLDNLIIIETNGDFEIWDEISAGNTIRFKTKEKKPYSFYSFEMENKLFKGYWFAEFEKIENGKTLFSTTESIEYKNPFIRVLAYIFMNLDKYMETYQEELRIKLNMKVYYERVQK